MSNLAIIPHPDSPEDLKRKALKEAWKAVKTDPLALPVRILGIKTMWSGAEDMISSVFSHKKIAVQAGHAMSKDWSAGVIVLNWLLRYWQKSKVIITAPSERQVKEVIFGEIEKQYALLCDQSPNFRRDWLKSCKLEFGPDSFALGFTTRDTNEMVGKFQGHHSPNILIIISEAQAVQSSIFKQIRGLMTSENSVLLELGNPLTPFGDFFDHCTNPRFGYKVIKLPCTISPNVIAGKEIIPGMAGPAFIQFMKDELGDDYTLNPEWQTRVLAEFPTQGNQAWIPIGKIKDAIGRVFDEEDDQKVGGLDTARSGEDETVHTVIRGNTMVKQDCFKKVLTAETVYWARELIQSSNIQILAIDQGYNPGIIDWLNFEKMPCAGINFGGISPSDKFENMGTYIWWNLRQAFINDEISIFDDPVLISQLASRLVCPTSRGKIKLETKARREVMDRADSLALAWYARSLLHGAKESISDADSENESSRMSDQINHVLHISRWKGAHNSEDDDFTNQQDVRSIASEISSEDSLKSETLFED